jgi:hypothetical protein
MTFGLIFIFMALFHLFLVESYRKQAWVYVDVRGSIAANWFLCALNTWVFWCFS